jgi:hypothetical protein
MNTKQVFLSGGTAAIVVILAFLAAAGRLPPQKFAIGCLSIMTLAILGWWFILLRSKPTDADIRAKSAALVPRSKKGKLTVVAGLLCWLIISLWVTRGEYWLARVVGAAFLSLLLIGAVIRARK